MLRDPPVPIPTERSGIRDTGFVYVATGADYVAEASISAKGLRAHHPGIPICLIIDKTPAGAPFWDDLIILSDPKFGFVDKIEMRQSPYEKSIFLDADTHVVGDLSEVFAMLDRFELCGVQLMEGHDYAIPGIPLAYPEVNSGFLAFRRSDRLHAFFALWQTLYYEFRAENKDGYYHYANEGDQKSLRAAVWNSDIRFLGLGPEFNFIPFKMEFACLPVRLIHSHQTEGIDALADRLNSVHARRVYVPALDVMISAPWNQRELAKLVLRSFLALIRHRLRPLLPQALKDRLRRSRLVTAIMELTRFSAGRPTEPGKDQ